MLHTRKRISVSTVLSSILGFVFPFNNPKRWFSRKIFYKNTSKRIFGTCLIKNNTMTSEEVFSLTNMIAMLMWLLMIGLPKWKFTRFLMEYKLVPLFLSLFYFFYMVAHLKTGGGLDFGSLASVMALFTFKNALMAGWVHYLAFDLLVGIWMLKQNEQLGIHQLLMAPCLIATFMLGPVGFLLFMIIRTIKLSK